LNLVTHPPMRYVIRVAGVPDVNQQTNQREVWNRLF